MPNSSKKNSKQITKKILILGLENSGKTSIVLSLTRDTNLLSYCSLKATKGINRVSFDNIKAKFSIWDFGGQEQYRKEYLEKLDKYLAEVDKIIYVIDIQDEEKYQLSLQYLEKIIQILKKAEEDFEVLVFLHKYDPDLVKKGRFSDPTISTKLIDKIKKMIPKNIVYQIFKSSIYTVFQKTLVP